MNITLPRDRNYDPTIETITQGQKSPPRDINKYPEEKKYKTPLPRDKKTLQEAETFIPRVNT